MNRDSRITQALAARPELVRSVIETLADRMDSLEVGQSAEFSHSISTETCRNSSINSSPTHRYFSAVSTQLLAEALNAVNVMADMYDAACVAALVISPLSDELMWVSHNEWGADSRADPLAWLVASTPGRNGKVKTFSVNTSIKQGKANQRKGNLGVATTVVSVVVRRDS